MPPTSFTFTSPKGRPLGASPKPPAPTVAEFVADALSAPNAPPPPLPPILPVDPNRRRGSIWSGMSPEERTALAKKLASLRDNRNMRRPSRKGVARGWSNEAFAVAQANARMEAAELVTRLKLSGLIAPDDKAGEQATLEALTFVRTPGSRVERQRVARRLLRFYAPPELTELV